MAAHRRQFVIGPEPRLVAERWTTRPLPGGLWLSHCADLPVAGSAGGSPSWVLLGLAVQTVPGAPDPIDELRDCPPDQLPGRYQNWSGRWLLVVNGEVHLDATGQLGCHWARADDGSIWASSSPGFMATIEGIGDRRAHRLRYERGLSWIVPPLGHREGLNRLLPSRILELRSGVLRPRALLPDIGPPGQPAPGDPVTLLAENLTEFVRRLPPVRPIHVALTSGADSRAVLAAAVASGRSIRVFTRRSHRMSIADRLIPPRLTAAVGLGHTELLPRPTAEDRLAIVAAHSDSSLAAPDVKPLLDGTRDDLEGIEIGGQGFGAGKASRRHFPAEIDDPVRLAERVADLTGEPRDSANRRALAHWLAEVVDDAALGLNPGLDWRDRFYLEQRMAGLQSAKEQVYDLHNHRRLCPINSARAYALMLACDESERAAGRHQRRLISTLEDRLTAVPVNPPSAQYPIPRRAHHLWIVDRRGAPVRVLRAAARGLRR